MPNASGRRQAAMASGNIEREAKRIAKERGLSVEEATAAVFGDPALLNKCLGVQPAEIVPPEGKPQE